MKQRLPGYANLIRFDAYGRVSCAAATTPPDATRANRRWFQRLATGSHMVVASIPGVAYADEPAVLTAVRAEKRDGRFDGAMAAVLTLSTIQPETANRYLPGGAEVALADSEGHVFAACLLYTSPSPRD